MIKRRFQTLMVLDEDATKIGVKHLIALKGRGRMGRGITNWVRTLHGFEGKGWR